MTTRIQVVFYSMYGHVYRLAEAVSEGAREVVGTEVSVYQVPELVPDDILEKTGAKAARTAFAHVPVAKPREACGWNRCSSRSGSGATIFPTAW